MNSPRAIRRVELAEPLAADEQQTFNLKVYTTGPRINRVTVYAESR